MFEFAEICRVTHAGESWPVQAVPYTRGSVGLVLLSSGRCGVRAFAGAGGQGAAGESEVAGGAGSLFITSVPFALEPLEACHCLCVVLEGRAAESFCTELSGCVAQDAGAYPALSALMLALCDTAAPPTARRQSAMGYDLLCLLEPDAPQTPGWPPLVQQAVRLIRESYGRLYGVEELAAELNVSKSHLVRVFHSTLGVTPGQFLNDTRIEAARQLLARGHSLEVVATLCGYSGANYLCKVFRKATGLTPAQFRRTVQPGPAAQNLAANAEAQLFL